MAYLNLKNADPIRASKETTILCNFAIQTDRKIKSKRLDIAVMDYKRRIRIDMSETTDKIPVKDNII